MSKPFRRFSWFIGTTSVATSILSNGYVSHAKGFTDAELKAMGMAS